MSNQIPNRSSRTRRFGVILGTNEIASAVAVLLHRQAYDIVLSHDPSPPVIRRKMAFHDALFGEAVTVEGIAAERAESSLALRGRLGEAHGVMVTELGLLDLIAIRAIDVLIDARMQKYVVKPDLRWLAKSTIGLGPGFVSGDNCDVAIETRPGKAGRIVAQGATDEPDGTPAPLGDALSERFGRAECNGRWHTAIDIGTRVYKGFVVGHLGGTAVAAPFDGLLRGVVRDDTDVPAGAKLFEVDPRGRLANATAFDPRIIAIAEGTIRALAEREESVAAVAARTIHLVK